MNTISVLRSSTNRSGRSVVFNAAPSQSTGQNNINNANNGQAFLPLPGSVDGGFYDNTADNEQKPLYQKPLTWIVGGLALFGAVALGAQRFRKEGNKALESTGSGVKKAIESGNPDSEIKPKPQRQEDEAVNPPTPSPDPPVPPEKQMGEGEKALPQTPPSNVNPQGNREEAANNESSSQLQESPSSQINEPVVFEPISIDNTSQVDSADVTSTNDASESINPVKSSESELDITSILPQSFQVKPGTEEYTKLKEKIDCIYRGEIPEGVTTLEEIAQIARPTAAGFQAFATKLNQELIGELPKEFSEQNITTSDLSRIAEIIVNGRKTVPSDTSFSGTTIVDPNLNDLQAEINQISNQIKVSDVCSGKGYFKLTIGGKDFGFKIYYGQNQTKGFSWNGALMGAHFLSLQPFKDFYSLKAIGLPIKDNTGWVLDEFVDKQATENRQGNSWVEYMKKVGINPSDHLFTGNRNRIDGVAIDRDDIQFGFQSHNQVETGSMTIKEFESIMNNPDPRVRQEAVNLLRYKIPDEEKLDAFKICANYPEVLGRLCYFFADASKGCDKQKVLEVLQPALLNILKQGSSYLDQIPQNLASRLSQDQVAMAKDSPEKFIHQLLDDDLVSYSDNNIDMDIMNIIRFAYRAVTIQKS